MGDLKLSGVKKRFGDVEIIHGVDLAINKGEFVVFVGPSGCGKSTLLRLIAGLEDLGEGDILINGQQVNHVAPSKRGVAMVFQSYALYPHMTVFDNMAFGLQVAKKSKEYIDKKVHEVAGILHLTELLDRKPKELSGGQRQRVAIGRAIARNPDIFLFDEPLSNLDAELRTLMRVELSRLHSQLKSTMIYVTHDQVEAMTLADRIVVLRAGHIEQFGTPVELYRAPLNQFVAGFIGSPKMNFIPAEIMACNGTGLEVQLPDQQSITVTVDPGEYKKGDTVTVGIRPEHINPYGQGDFILNVECQLTEYLGELTLVHGRYAEHPLTLKADGEQRVEKGRSLAIGANLEDIYLFDSDGHSLVYGRQSSRLGDEKSIAESVLKKAFDSNLTNIAPTVEAVA